MWERMSVQLFRLRQRVPQWVRGVRFRLRRWVYRVRRQLFQLWFRMHRWMLRLRQRVRWMQWVRKRM